MAGVVKAMDSALSSMNLEKVRCLLLVLSVFYYVLPGYNNHGEVREAI